MRALTARQRLFVAEYPKDMNAKQAAIRAGYSPKCARTTAQELLRQPHVRAAVAEAQATVAIRNDITVDDYLRELARLRDLASTNKQMAAAVAAQELRGRVLGFFKDDGGGAKAAAFVLNISGIDR